MKRYGYHRTSTREQHLDRGIKEITAYCEQNNLELEKIFTDQQTGKNFNRPRYQVLKEDVLRVGDELIITEVDRLGRNKQETLKELQYYRDNGIRVKILELPTTLMDLSKLDNAMARMLMETINNMLIELYAAMAQAEIEKKEKRQREGIDAKKNRGELRRIIRDCNDEVLEKDENATVLLPRFSCHTLRHTFTTRLIEAGVNPKVVQDTLGHKDISTTLGIYASVTNEFKKSAYDTMAVNNSDIWKI